MSNTAHYRGEVADEYDLQVAEQGSAGTEHFENNHEEMTDSRTCTGELRSSSQAELEWHWEWEVVIASVSVGLEVGHLS